MWAVIPLKVSERDQPPNPRAEEKAWHGGLMQPLADPRSLLGEPQSHSCLSQEPQEYADWTLLEVEVESNTI